ncbi:cysteine proteinase, partial [Rhizodiscina lignyota]
SEFPLLSAIGLYAAQTQGDGNCLFNALSDQLYGEQSQHRQIRNAVIEHMREQSSHYKAYVDVHPGGGTRRNPKRKNAGAYSAPVAFSPPTEEEIDRAFENHLKTMAQGGTYGDNMEIVAFATAFNTDVRIYQRDFAYVVEPIQGVVAEDNSGERPVLHIAYHTWEHYSTIRNLDGPHTGLPHVRVKALSPEEEKAQKEKLEQTPVVAQWMIDVVTKSLPFLADKLTIKKTLEETKGNIDLAVSKLLDAEDGGFTSSAQESSSVERGASKKEEDEDSDWRPETEPFTDDERASSAPP